MTFNRMQLLSFGAGLALAGGAAWADGREGGVITCGQAVGWAPMFQPQPPTVSTDQVPGFSLVAGGVALQDTPVGSALEQIEQGQWVQAIHTLQSLDAADPRMVIDHHGVLRPIASLKTSLITSLPDEGQRVFRRLNDTIAQHKLEQANAAADLNERQSAYQALLGDYPLCDAAASAAQQLGDIHFEQGRFDDAAELYRFAADHPAAASDQPMMMARQLMALARADRWQAFDVLAQYAQFRHADTAVELGGQAVTLDRLIQSMMQSRIDQAIDDDAGQADNAQPIALPTDDRPVFKRQLISDRQRRDLLQAATNHRINAATDQILRPSIATDGQCLYTNTLGSVARIDPQTGQDLWRIGDPDANASTLIGNIHLLQRGYSQSLAIAGDTLLAVVCEAPQGPHDAANVPVRPTGHTLMPGAATLIALDAHSGETHWAWPPPITAEAQQIVMGTPLVIDDRIYFVCRTANSAQVSLIAVDIESGEQTHAIALGSSANIAGLNAPAEMSPRLTMGDCHLIVQTNNGALIAIDTADHTVAWAHTQDIRTSWIEGLRNNGFAAPDAIAQHTGTAVARLGLVIAKDTRSNTLNAIRENDGQLIWSNTTDPDATIVHHDNQHIYVLGKQLYAYDIHTGQRVWWTTHAGSAPGQPAFTDHACVVQGQRRLCQIELATGRLTDYREITTGPADLTRVGDTYIHLTANHITGYAHPDTSQHESAQPTDRSIDRNKRNDS